MGEVDQNKINKIWGVGGDRGMHVSIKTCVLVKND